MAKFLWGSLGLLVGMGGVCAQTTWPAVLAENVSAASLSTRAIRLPADVRLTRAAPAAAGARAAWSGGWRGWGCQGFSCDVGLVVEDIRGDQATIVVALAAAGGLDISQRLQARFVGNELEARLADGTSVHFRQRPDRQLDFMWRRQQDWVGGVLTKDDSTAQERQRAAQEWLARDAFDVDLLQPAKTYTVRVRPKKQSTDFLADAADECLSNNVPTRTAFAEPYVLIEFAPTLRGCGYKVQYRAQPVTGRAWAFRSEDGGATWRQIVGNSEIRLSR